MTNLLHPFTRGPLYQGCTSWNGEYHFTPRTGGRGERHCHDHYEIYVHLQGGELYSLEKELVPMEPNQLIVVPPFCMHGLFGDRELINYERVFLNITPAALAEAGSGIIDFSAILQRAAQQGSYFFPMPEQDAQECKKCILSMQDSGGSTLDRFGAYLAMLQYLQIVCRTISDTAPAPERQTAYPLMQQILIWLDDHCTENIALTDVARAFNMSVSSLCHQFSRYNMHSVYEYVLYRRVMLACDLVKKGESLTAVAYQCGFNNYNTFMRTFRRFLGMTPSAYCRQEREEAGATPMHPA